MGKQTIQPVKISRVIGYILITPPLLSVFLFLIDIIARDFNPFRYLSFKWTGGVGGYTSALPFYFGLMAIAGAYLIKDSYKNYNNGYSNRRD